MPLDPRHTDITLSLAPTGTAANWHVQVVNPSSTTPKVHGRLWADEEEAATHRHKIFLALAGFVAMSAVASHTNLKCQQFPDQQIKGLLAQLRHAESTP